jgi:hypothetical protein
VNYFFLAMQIIASSSGQIFKNDPAFAWYARDHRHFRWAVAIFGLRRELEVGDERGVEEGDNDNR